MKKLFGTDGIRAVAGQYPLDSPTVFVLGKALVKLIKEEGLGPRILIGRDTRESGPAIEEALVRGIAAGGGEAVSAGVIPTSAVSFLTQRHRFAAGIVISASHNPYQDNGIKIFSSRGTKIPDEWELRLENSLTVEKADVQSLDKIQAVPEDPILVEDYEEFLLSQVGPLRPSKDLQVVLDCSNGASSAISPKIFSKLDVGVIAIFNSPDGRNINRRCGSLHPHNLARHVVAARADLGVAYDGDADRAIWVDERGRILSGDHTLFVMARSMKEKGRLRSNRVVATTMSNMGLEKALRDMGIELVRTRVGDKYVLEKMIELEANLGGEQSGHTIFLDDCPTGDGILTSLKMMEAMLEAGVRLSELTGGLRQFPQIHRSVRVREKADFSGFPEIMAVMDEIRTELSDAGRLDVRYSGTEAVARVMIEGPEEGQIEGLAQKMTKVIARFLGEQ
jgi:phosphoglucosamine mutase